MRQARATSRVSPPKIAIFGSSAVQCSLTNAHARARAAGLPKKRARYAPCPGCAELGDSARWSPRSTSAGSRNRERVEVPVALLRRRRAIGGRGQARRTAARRRALRRFERLASATSDRAAARRPALDRAPPAPSRSRPDPRRSCRAPRPRRPQARADRRSLTVRRVKPSSSRAGAAATARRSRTRGCSCGSGQVLVHELEPIGHFARARRSRARGRTRPPASGSRRRCGGPRAPAPTRRR